MSDKNTAPSFIEQTVRVLEQVADAEQTIDAIAGSQPHEASEAEETRTEPECQIDRLADLLDALERRLTCLARRLHRIRDRF